MKKHPKIKNVLLNKLHRGFVYTCIAVTLYGSAVLGIRYYKYVTETKPQFESKKLLEKQELLAEGSSDALADTTPSLKL